MPFDTCPSRSAATCFDIANDPSGIMKNTSLALAACMTAGMLSSAAWAQSSSGNIVGEANQGDTIVVTGVDTGFKRELKIDKDGKYQIRRVPTGDYQVIRVRSDGSIDPVQKVVIHAGTTGRVLNPVTSDAKGAP